VVFLYLCDIVLIMHCFSDFMPLMRNREIWSPCLQPITQESEITPIHIMNQYFLSGASSRCSNFSSRPPSPLSDSDLEIERTDCQGIAVEKDSDFAVAAQLAIPVDDFHHPDPNSSNYMVLDTNFNINSDKNRKVPYPKSNEMREAWTVKQRFHASQAQIPVDRSDFANKVRKHSTSLYNK